MCCCYDIIRGGSILRLLAAHSENKTFCRKRVETTLMQKYHNFPKVESNFSLLLVLQHVLTAEVFHTAPNFDTPSCGFLFLRMQELLLFLFFFSVNA